MDKSAVRSGQELVFFWSTATSVAVGMVGGVQGEGVTGFRRQSLCCPTGGVDLKNFIFLYLIYVLQVPKHLYVVGIEHRECSRTFNFEQ